MFTAIRTRLADRKAKTAARDRFFAADDAAGLALDRLGNATDPRERAKFYRRAADACMDMCRLHNRAFGDTDVDSDGRTVADSLRLESMLLRVLGDVEHVVACNGRVGRNWRFPEFGEAADAVLDQMLVADLDGRLDLLNDLYEAVVGRVGGQAAEVLVNIA